MYVFQGTKYDTKVSLDSNPNWRTPNSLRDSNVSPKQKIVEE
jgi:hypothetical protein